MNARIVFCVIGVASCCSVALWLATRLPDRGHVAATASSPPSTVSRREYLARLVAETAARSAAETAAAAPPQSDRYKAADDTRLASSNAP
jgi:hypothetical protein